MKWLWIVVLAVPAMGQTVSPLVVECGPRCRGSFTVSNESVRAMATIIEPLSFSLGPDGRSIFRVLDSTVKVNLNDSSARIGPKSSHDFDYEIVCSQAPCLVALRAEMSLGHTDTGLEVHGLIPHIIYQCEKSKNCRKNIRLAAGLSQ
jgi:hypothetical protein